MVEDRRQHPRYAVEIEARVVADGAEFRAQTRDLSRSGMCFVTPEAVSVGIPVVIEAALRFSANAFSEALPLSARVMWCTAVHDGYQVGVAFTRLHPQTVEYLDLFLKYLKGEIDVRSGEPIMDEEAPEDDGDKFA
ncbi:MAG: PilZ domain-containing protein [Deltaproteobacteria bacterium]|nr:PilZ domain-containing protein [Deltaproteobacteria bacterium]